MPTNTISDRVTRLHLPLIVACAGWMGVLGTVVVAARYEVTADLGSGLDQNLEAAEDQALAVERHRVDVGLNTRIGHHLLHALVAGLS